MSKKKVTLSLDSKIYDEFRRFCDDNAIMLSKKVELVMKELMKKKFLVFWFLFFAILSNVSATVIISSCEQDINSSASYVLNQSITSSATCLTTNSSNVEIDCDGKTITYGTSGAANSFGIKALHSLVSQTNLTIKNCILVKPVAAGASGRGISLTRFANSTIFNNTISTNGSSSNVGIYISTGSDRNNLSQNTIITSGTAASNYGISLNAGSADTVIEYNRIFAGSGTATSDNYGISITDPRAKAVNNVIFTFGSQDSNYGIFSSSSANSIILNNTIFTSGSSNNRGIYLSGSDSNLIANNSINTTGQASVGIYLLNSGSENVINNQINSSADSIYMFSATLNDFVRSNITRDNTRFGRNITFYGGGALTLPCPNNTIFDNPPEAGLKFIGCSNITVKNWYRPNRDTDGLFFVNSDNNLIVNNTIIGAIIGLEATNNAATSDNNIIVNNTFSSYGYVDGYAVRIYGNNNTIFQNNLSTNGITSGNNGINLHNDFNNVINNLISTAGTSGNIGINLESGASSNLIQNNTITTSGTSGNSGIYFVSGNILNSVSNNTITTSGTSGNFGMRLVTNSNNNTIQWNKFYTQGSTSGNTGVELSSSSSNLFKHNEIYAGYRIGTTDNDAVSLINSRNNSFAENIIFSNGTSTSLTSAAIFLQSNSIGNLFVNNLIVKSVGNAIELDFSTTYPSDNSFQNNSLGNVSGSDLFFLDPGINRTTFIDQEIGKYNFSGVGGKIGFVRTRFGRIDFISAINGSGQNLSNDIQVSFNFAYVNSSNKGLNASSNVSLYNLPVNFSLPVIKRDGLFECNLATTPSCASLTSLNAGNVSFNVTSWGSYYMIAESADLAPPNLVLISPQNKNYSSGNLLVNYSVSDGLSGVQSCWYNLAGFPGNHTLANCGTTSLSLADGSYTLFVYANDSAGNVNYSSANFVVDSTPPQWSSLQQSVPSVYSNVSLAFFNVSWSDSSQIGSVIFESNFSGTDRNYSMHNLGGNVYGFNVSIPAGEFYWRSYANDSLGNMNISSTQTFTVGKAGNFVNLRINGVLNLNVTINYSTQSNVSATSEVGAVLLARDSVGVSNPEIKVLAAKSEGYLYNASVAETQNYSANSSSYYLFVNKLNSNVNLTLNGVSDNLSTTYGIVTNASATAAGNYSTALYRDGVQVSSQDVNLLGVGYYNYTAFVAENENVSGSSANYFLNVSRASASLNVLINGAAFNSTMTYGTLSNLTAYETMSGDADVIYSFYKNGILLYSGSSVSDVGILGAGTYEYTFSSSGGQNYSAGTISKFLNITKAPVTLSISLNNVSANSAQTYGNASVVKGNSSVSGLELVLYKNGGSVMSGSNINYSELLGAADYNFTLSYSGNENYSSASLSRFLNVQKAAPLLYLALNGFSSDISSAAGSVVVINATSVNPAPWQVNLYEDDKLQSSGSGTLNAERTYVNLGEVRWTVEFSDSQNYSESNVSYIVSVVDPDSPQYSNIVVSPASGAHYVPSRNYVFNATWTDNIAVDTVVFTFNNVNYSSSSGQVTHEGNVYSFGVSDLGVGSYSYKWSANDTSGNFVSSPMKTYSVQQASTSLVVQISPSQTVSYGTVSSVTCYGSNVEVEPQLIRDVIPIPNLPDSGVFAVGSYTYFCNSAATQNYSSGNAIPSVLNVQKAQPQINLSLNGLLADATLPPSGGEVNISTNLVSPSSGFLNLSVEGILINGGASPLQNVSYFSAVGSYHVSSYFDGNQNYSSGIVTRIVSVSAPQTAVTSSGGGGGGSGRTGVGEVVFSNSSSENGLKLEISAEDVILKRGTETEFNVEVVNRDNKFLNGCKISFSGVKSSWFSNTDSKGLSSGEKFVYKVKAKIPESEESGNYFASAVVKCDEGEKSSDFFVSIYRNSFEPEITSYAKDGNRLVVNYSVSEFAGENHDLILLYSLSDFEGISRYRGQKNLVLGPKQTVSDRIDFDLPKDSFGEFNFEMTFSDSVVEVKTNKNIFLPSGNGLTGLAITDENRKTLNVVGLVALIGICFALVYFTRKLRKKKVPVFHQTHYAPQNKILTELKSKFN